MNEWDDILKDSKDSFEQAEFEIKDSYRADLIQKLDEFDARAKSKKKPGGLFFFLFDLILLIAGSAVLSFSFSSAHLPPISALEQNHQTEKSKHTDKSAAAFQTSSKSKFSSISEVPEKHSSASKTVGRSTQKMSKEKKTSISNHRSSNALGIGADNASSLKTTPHFTKQSARSVTKLAESVELLARGEHAEEWNAPSTLNYLASRGTQLFPYAPPNSIFQSVTPQERPHLHPRAHQRNPNGKWSLVLAGGAQWSFPQQKEFSQHLQGASQVQIGSLLSPSIQFVARRNLSGALGIGIGFQYSQLGESVTFETTAADHRTIQFQQSDTSYDITDRSYMDIDSAFIQGRWIITDCTWVELIDTLTTISQLTRDSIITDSLPIQHQGKNSYHFFELPVILSYTVLERPSWRVHCHPGVSVGFVSIRSNVLNPYLSEAGKASSNQWMFSALLFGDLERRVTKDLWVHLGLGGQYTFYSGLEMAGERRIYLLFQTRLGITYTF